MNTLTVGANTWQIPVTSVNGQTGDITVTSPSASSATPADLGTAAAGTSDDYSRADHVHRMLTAADLSFLLPQDSGSGAIVSFPDGADNVPVEALSVAITPVQSGSGTPAPDNIRPITGHTQAVVTRTGINVWDEEWELATINWSTYIFTPSPSGGRLASKNYIPVKEGATYYVKAPSGVGGIVAGYSDSSGSNGISISVSVNVQVTIPSGIHFIKIGVATVEYGTTYNNDISVNYPATDHDYHAHTIQTVTIDLSGTRYGGTLDVLTGVLRVTHGFTEYDGSNDENWITESIGAGRNFYISVPLASKEQYGSKLICSLFATSNASAAQKDKVFISTGKNLNATVGDSLGVSTVAAFKTWLSANNMQICYELQTPFDVQLSPNQLQTLLGQNNVWADTGDTSVTYRADIGLYIDKKTS